MITWVSDRSGIASSGIFLSVQIDPIIATTTKVRTRNLLWAENSISFSITPPLRRVGDWPVSAEEVSDRVGSLAMLVFSTAHPTTCTLARRACAIWRRSAFGGCGRWWGHALQRGLQTTLGVDQEVAAGYDQLPLRHTTFDFVIVIRLDPDGDVPRFKQPLTLVDKRNLLGAGVKHRFFGNGQDLAHADRDRGVDEHLRLQHAVRVGEDRPRSEIGS